MVFTVTLSPSLDYFVTVDTLTLGALHRTRDERLVPGGKGLNVALVLRTLGVPTRALGFVAGQTGALWQTLAAQTGLDCDFLTLPQGETRLNVKIRADSETALNGAPPAPDEASLAALEAKLDPLGAGDVLVLSGAAAADCYPRLLRRVGGRGVYTVVDAAGDTLRQTLPLAPSLIKPNWEELAALCGKAPQTPAETVRMARALQAEGAQTVLVSLGADGAVLIPQNGDALALAAPQGAVRSTVGAGDAMLAGFVAARNLCPAGVLRRAVAAGSAAAFSDWLPDAGLLRTVLTQTPEPVTRDIKHDRGE